MMNFDEGLSEVRFTDEQIRVLGTHLDLQFKEAYIAAAVISSTAWMCNEFDEARCKTPVLKDAKRRLDKIASTASQLARMLEEDPAIATLFLTEDDLDLGGDRFRDDAGALCLSDMFKARDDYRVSFISRLRRISQNADRLIADERLFRGSYGLLPAMLNGKSSTAACLWPKLFELWEYAGRRVAKTPGGPLYRFVSFVHVVMKLEEPKTSTLQDSVAEWEQGGRRARLAEHPPWWSDGQE